MEFALDPTLEGDSFFVCDLALCRVLLMNNSLFPWIILVPRVAGATEIIDLPPENRNTLMDEICHASTVLQALVKPDKLNVAALGNQVKQLHVHIIARVASDPAWPNPVWGRGGAPYGDPVSFIRQLVKQLLAS